MRALALICLAATAAHADGGDRWNGATVGIQVGLGAAGGFAGAFLGAKVAALTTDTDDWGAVWQLGCGAVGAFVGTVAMTTVAGDLRDSTGHWYGAAAGAAIGTGLFVLEGYLFVDDLPGWALVASGAVLTLGGAVVGYQLSAKQVAMPVMAFRF